VLPLQPVLQAQSRHPTHLADVAGDERRGCGKRVSGDGRVKVFNPVATSFECGFDAAKGGADLVGPLRMTDLPAYEVEARL